MKFKKSLTIVKHCEIKQCNDKTVKFSRPSVFHKFSQTPNSDSTWSPPTFDYIKLFWFCCCGITSDLEDLWVLFSIENLPHVMSCEPLKLYEFLRPSRSWGWIFLDSELNDQWVSDIINPGDATASEEILS